MTTAGSIFMAVSWGAIFGLNIYCLWHLFRSE